MANHVRHFAINCDDVDRARRFYSEVFNWTFFQWGPPDFFQIHMGDPESPSLGGALQKRREIVPGVRMNGFECSIGVADIDATMAAIVANGGKIVMPKAHIPTVGTLVLFQDPEGNIAGAMQYESDAQ